MRQFKLKITVSNSHVHLTKEDAVQLFGSEKFDDAGSKGHAKFNLSNQKVTLKGPKGELRNIRVLIPFSKERLVELNRTHSFVLGIQPPLGDGKLKEGFVTIIGTMGEITVRENVIIEQRHLEITSAFAEKYCLKHGQIVSAMIEGVREVLFRKVAVKIVQGAKPGFEGTFEIDRDEANATMSNEGDMATIIIE